MTKRNAFRFPLALACVAFAVGMAKGPAKAEPQTITDFADPDALSTRPFKRADFTVAELVKSGAIVPGERMGKGPTSVS